MQNKSTFTRILTLVLVSMLLVVFTAWTDYLHLKPTATPTKAPAQGDTGSTSGDGREMEGNMYLTVSHS